MFYICLIFDKTYNDNSIVEEFYKNIKNNLKLLFQSEAFQNESCEKKVYEGLEIPTF